MVQGLVGEGTEAVLALMNHKPGTFPELLCQLQYIRVEDSFFVLIYYLFTRVYKRKNTYARKLYILLLLIQVKEIQLQYH